MTRRFSLIVAILYIFFDCATEYNRDYTISKAKDYIKEGKFDSAYYEFVSALSDHPDDIEMHREFIRFSSQIHRCDEAKDFYNKSVYRDGKWKYIYYYAKALLGASCFDCDREQILNDLREAIRLKGDENEIRLRYGVLLVEYEMFEEALKEFEILYKRGYKLPSVNSYIALCSVHTGENERAIKAVQEMLNLDFSEQDLKRASSAIDIINSPCLDVPDHIKEDFKRILDMILKEDNPVRARESVENILLTHPDEPALHLLKSLSLALTGEFSSSLYELNRLKDASKSCSYFQYAAGIIYLGVQKEEKGISHLEKAIELDPLFVRAYLILSDLYINRKEYSKAERLLRLYLKLTPADNKSRFTYGRVLLKLGRIAEAEKEFKHILEEEPENLLGIVGMGIVERQYAKVEKDRKKREGHMKKSFDYLNSAIMKDPENENIKSLINSINMEE